MAKIEVKFLYTCAKDISHEKKGRDERSEREIKIRMDGKNVRIDIDTCEMQETHGGSPYLIQGHGRHRSARRNSV